MFLIVALSFASLLGICNGVHFSPLPDKPGLVDNGTFGPTVEVVHLFHNAAPIGIALSKSGRAFVTFNRGPPLNETPITVAEIIDANTEVAYPNLELNTPPEGLVNTSSGRPLGSSDSKHFINAQAVIIDPLDRLWVLDNGRPVVGGDILPAVPGGPKLMGFELENNATTPFITITFPESVLPALGYLNDVRFDFRSNLTESGKGIAYIADTSGGLIVADLGTGISWRHLDHLRELSPISRFLPTFFGVPTYTSTATTALHYENVAGGGIDGFTLSADGKYLYFTPLASRNLFRVETVPLRVNPADDKLAFIRAANTVQFLGEMGGQADGFESDNTNKIYLSNPEHNAISVFDPSTGLVSPFVRSPIIAWPDTMSVANDGFIYATLDQLWLSPVFQGGVDKRVKPFALVRMKIDGGKIELV